LRGSTIRDDGEEKKLFRALILRKRRHQRERKKETKNGQKFAHKSKKKEKRKKKRSDLFLLHSSAQETLYKEREREKARVYERKKKMSENIINKDNNKQMTTRERQHIEVAKLEAELNALKVDAFAKVRVVVVVFSSSSYVGCAF
jgi:hypothetical protein